MTLASTQPDRVDKVINKMSCCHDVVSPSAKVQSLSTVVLVTMPAKHSTAAYELHYIDDILLYLLQLRRIV